MPKRIITDRVKAREKGLMKNGRYFIRTSDRTPMYIPIWYGNRIDLEGLLLYQGEECDANPDIPDLTTLVKTGKVEEAEIFRSHEVNVTAFTDCTCRRKFTEKIIQNILQEFKNKGFNVTREALTHNFRAWHADLRSGYRDEANGCHLFTPCGCNPLSFRVSSLEEDLDWQTTYMF